MTGEQLIFAMATHGWITTEQATWALRRLEAKGS